jgi:hypothetical protein
LLAVQDTLRLLPFYGWYFEQVWALTILISSFCPAFLFALLLGALVFLLSFSLLLLCVSFLR